MNQKKFYIVDYTYNDNVVRVAMFCHENGTDEAAAFCREVKRRDGSVNIRIRDVVVPV